VSKAVLLLIGDKTIVLQRHSATIMRGGSSRPQLCIQYVNPEQTDIP
jgi:hypothetical protein